MTKRYQRPYSFYLRFPTTFYSRVTSFSIVARYMEDFDKPVNKLFNQLTAKSVYPLQK